MCDTVQRVSAATPGYEQAFFRWPATRGARRRRVCSPQRSERTTTGAVQEVPILKPEEPRGLDLEIRSRQCLALHAVRTERLSVPENATAFSEGFNRFADTRRCGPISKRIKNTRAGSMLRPARIRILAKLGPGRRWRADRHPRHTDGSAEKHLEGCRDTKIGGTTRPTPFSGLRPRRSAPMNETGCGSPNMAAMASSMFDPSDERHHEKWRMPTPRGAR
jgi:hypothetical protein